MTAEREPLPGSHKTLEPIGHRALKLAVIGTAAGVFSGLFGVGGGTVIVPLLMLWLGYGPREATGTSLAAIVFIAAFAAATQGVYGNVHVLDAVLMGVPAVGGVLIGTWLQQRLGTRTISLLFAAVLVASAVELLAQ
ncbi:MAG TPA: sulfite exporter TauE/SafE family protein [Solirubrobacteraceae bacterium]